MRKLLFCLTFFLAFDILSTEDCGCVNDSYVQKCQMEGYIYTGTCKSPNLRTFGLSEYPSGTTFYGNYYSESGESKVGKFTWSDGDFAEGEFSPDGTSFIGKLIQGKKTSTGFFINSRLFAMDGFGFTSYDNSMKNINVTYVAAYWKTSVKDKKTYANGYYYRESRNKGWKQFCTTKNNKFFGKCYVKWDDGRRTVEDYGNGRSKPRISNKYEDKDEAEYQVYQEKYQKDLEAFLPVFEEVEKRYLEVVNNKEKAVSKLAEKKPSKENLERVLLIQEHLLSLGYEPGEVDGKLGLKTTLAIKAFQFDNKLDIDGLVTEELLIYLASALRKQRQG